MKVIILGGFLGSGKTTLLMQLVKRLADTATSDDQKTKIVILENEIGKTSVDGTTLKHLGIQMKELLAGCVCCTLQTELATTLQEIESTLNPNWLIIEATGLAYPDKTAEAVRQYIKNLEYLTTIVLVNAQNFLQLAKIVPLISGQPQFADLLLVNKIDLVDSDTKKATINQLREINTRAPLLEICANQPLANEFFTEVIK